MNFLTNVFNVVLYQPLFNALILLYQYLPGHDFGIAVIVLTFLIRLLLYPLMTQSLRNQKIFSRFQKETQEIQRKYQQDKERQMKEMVDLYQKEKINPFAGFLPLLVQLPLLIALYRVFWRGLQIEELSYLYSFVSQPKVINPTFLGILDLSKASLGLAILAGILQFLQSEMMTTSQKIAEEKIQKQMFYFFPILTVLILLKLPAAVGLYWVITILFSIFQQHLILKEKI